MKNDQTVPAVKTARNVGVDALRLLAMFFVVMLHVIGNGRILDNTTGLAYKLALLLETVAYCAVNCYAAISGYVAYSETEKPYRYEKYSAMWLQVFTYAFGVTLIVFLLGFGNVSLKDLIYCALPVTTGRYWYFSVYTALFFLVPYLNRFARSVSTRQLTALVLLMFLMLICYGCVTNPFAIGNGYGLPWLVIMYLFGVWMKKSAVADKLNSGVLTAVLLVSWLFTWLFTLYSPVKRDMLLAYTSPTIVLAALCLLALFSKMSFGSTARRCVSFFAPAAFGVYVIHMQPALKDTLLPVLFSWICALPWWLVPFAILGSVAAVFVVCLLIEKLRIWLFTRLKINAFAEKVFGRITQEIQKLAQKFILTYFEN